VKREEEKWPRVRLEVGLPAARGVNVYVPIPETVEYVRQDIPLLPSRSLALGRVMFVLERRSGELLGIHSYVKTSRWKTEGVGEPPEPDAEGALFLEYPGDKDLTFFKAEPDFRYNEVLKALRITFLEGTRLAFQVADCLVVGADEKGRLTEVWMLRLPLAME